MIPNRLIRQFSATTGAIQPAIDVLIVGGGVVGLAIARSLKNKSVVVVEKENKFGQGVSSRSSEVVHAGIYYPRGSKKAKFCVEGRRELKKYCLERDIPFRQRGKLIVATDASQEAGLLKVAAHAKANGVGEEPGEGLELISRREIKSMEPELQCHSALWSPATAVIDSHAYMSALETDALENGVDIAYGSSFVSASLDFSLRKPVFHAVIESADGKGASKESIPCSSIINCAGLHAPDVAKSIITRVKTHDEALPCAHYCKGNYFKLEGVKNPFERLIYPLPEAHGLGVHLTIDIGGNARFGPDVEWIDQLDESSYVVDPKRADSFYGAIRTYWPNLPNNCLVPDYAGIRPKLGPASVPAFDFILMDPTHHKVPGLIHCFGIESPGLTSSWAIANHIGNVINNW